MSESPNKLTRFWQELKRRKTGKVIIAYAATAFIILQLTDILSPAFSLPDWTTKLVTYLLAIGFPIAVIFSWVFDITPEGIKKTESLGISESKEIVISPTMKVGGACNHIHIVTHIHPTVCIAFLIKDIKEASHALILRERSLFLNFPGWQVGYSGFTYHISSKNSLINYVKNQAEHHKTISFKAELIRLLKENEIDFKEEYLFI